MPATALAEAFEAAGYATPDAQLRQLALEAWTRWPGKEAGENRRRFIEHKIAHELTWHLMTRHFAAQLGFAIGALLNSVGKEIANGGQQAGEVQGLAAAADGRGQPAPDGQTRPAPVIDPSNRGPTTAETLNTPASESGSTNPSLEARAETSTAHLIARHAETIAAKLAYSAKLSKLDQFSVNGKRLRQAAVYEIKHDEHAFGVRSLWYRHLTANMADHWVLGDYINDEMAEELYQRAEAEYAQRA